MAIAARAGVRSVQVEQIHAAYAMGGTRLQIIWHVIMKAALPEIFTGMRIGIGVGWICVISAEMISGRLGVGYRTWQAYTVVDYPQVFVGMLTIGVLGALVAAPLLVMLVREPARGQMDGKRSVADEAALPMGASFALFLRRRQGKTLLKLEP